MNSPGAVALIGLAGVVVGALVSLAGSVWTTRIADRQASQERLRIAYQAFIVALDHFDELWEGDIDQDDAAIRQLGPQTREYAEAIQVAFAPVLLLASKQPREAAYEARKAAWAIYNYLCPLPGQAPGTTGLPALVQNFRDARHAFETPLVLP
jgi:hypothetical protein